MTDAIDRCLVLFLVELVVFFVATLNYRFCAKGHITRTVFTDCLLAALGFVVIKLVSEAHTWQEMACYVFGAGLGSLAAMRLTKGMASGE